MPDLARLLRRVQWVHAQMIECGNSNIAKLWREAHEAGKNLLSDLSNEDKDRLFRVAVIKVVTAEDKAEEDERKLITASKEE